jgi:two-component system response regulator DegU
MTKIKVCVVDDHTLFRRLMVEEVQRFDRCDKHVLDAANGLLLLELLKAKPCDVLLLDISMPVMNGYDAAKYVLEKYKKTKVIILTMNDSYGPIVQFMEMGVHGYLLKDCNPEEVKQAIYDVYDHDFYTNELAVKALQSIAVRSKVVKTTSLTATEIQIILYICQELTMNEIAAKLFRSERTIENHRTHILKKIGAHNTVGIVKYAYETGLISGFRK